MADLITFETLVDNLNDELNTLASTLKTASKIDREIQVNISPHYQDNEQDKKYADDVVIGAIAYRGAGAFAPSQTYQGNTDSMVVIFDAFTRDSDDMDYLLNEYASQNTGKLVKSGDWVYWASFDKPSFLNRDVDASEERISVVLEIVYNFVYKGVLADDITITFNGTEVPVLSYSSKIEKNGPVTDTIGDVGKEKAVFTRALLSKTIKFIHINETEINNILEDIDSGDYLNRTYTIVYTITDGYTKSHTMVLSTGGIEFADGGFQTIEATFLTYNDLS